MPDDKIREAIAVAICDTFNGGSSGLDDMAMAIAQSHADAALKAITAAGYVVVPYEPTPLMITAHDNGRDKVASWKSMCDHGKVEARTANRKADAEPYAPPASTGSRKDPF